VPGHPAADVDLVLRRLTKDFSGKYLLLGFQGGQERCKFDGAIGSR
jgi:hypothetical protein